MDSRKIQYADPEEDLLQIEVDIAVNRSMEDNFRAYCETIVALYAMAEIDVVNYPVKRVIAYANEQP
jgi:hypothetical protein